MFQRTLCPTLIGREAELFVLEDSLLAARRGQSRLVALGGEAGLGKTRVVSELARRATALDFEVLWGACSEAELALPYLPLVEAIGNYISRKGSEHLATELGGARRELAQLFPQLGEEAPGPVGDPGQAKLRLFEAVVALLAVPARERGLLLVIDDIHWADSATRELVDHLARRFTNQRAVLVVTYRSDELERRHPLRPLLQNWRRSGAVEMLTLAPLEAADIGGMIAAILDKEEVEPELTALMHARTDGNPFVLEEMLREAIDRGPVAPEFSSPRRRSFRDLSIPETVRETILSRFARLDADEADVLQSAAVLGWTFDYETLVAVAGAPQATVQQALAAGVEQQLLTGVAGDRPTYQWRHALTQEAVADEIVLPRRQEIHSRAATAAAAAGASSLEVARHLLDAARFDDAVPACIAAAEEAEASLAFREAADLLERALPHVREPRTRAGLLCRLGKVLWMDGKPAPAEALLSEGVPALEAAGEELEAARYRLVLARSRWELSRPQEALADFECARDVLGRYGPSADLALAYLRLSGLYKFEFRAEQSIDAAEKAVDVARVAAADFERIWAQSWLGYALQDSGRVAEGARMVDEAFEEARRRGFLFIAHNIAYNDAWTRLHTMAPGVGDRLQTLAAEPGPPVITDMVGIAISWSQRIRGKLCAALETIETAHDEATATTNEKVKWRARVELSEVLLELGRLEEATAALPPVSERAELQDIVYDAAPQIRLRLARGCVEEAVALAREIHRHVDRLAPYPDALAVAVEALTAARNIDEARSLLDGGRAYQSDEPSPYLEEAEGRLLLASGLPAEARQVLTALATKASRRGYQLVSWRARTLAAEALARIGSVSEAEHELQEVAAEAHTAHAALVNANARTTAEHLGLVVPEPPERPADAGQPEPTLVGAGERLVTLLFADIRGFSGVASAMPPAELVDRVQTLHRWAAAEVSRHHGFVDKFAGDAVMATFNATGARLDHTVHAVEAGLALTDKAAMLDLGVGIGIAVGPAVVARTVAGGNISVLGVTTNLAARLQTAARAGEIVLSDEAHRRTANWLRERGLEASRAELELKGFDGLQPVWRIPTRAPMPYDDHSI
jgi:class 3 adenylate cyclase/tetratricopeptide (TPR) repeat protein